MSKEQKQYKIYWQCANADKCGNCSLAGEVVLIQEGQWKGYEPRTFTEMKEDNIKPAIFDSVEEADEEAERIQDWAEVAMGWTVLEVETIDK